MVMATQLIISLGIFILHLHYAVTDSSIMTIPLSRRIKIDRRKERKLSCSVALLTYILSTECKQYTEQTNCHQKGLTIPV